MKKTLNTNIPDGKYMYKVKIYYKKTGHLYANMFETLHLEFGMRIGSIIGWRKMNTLEKFIFRNCR